MNKYTSPTTVQYANELREHRNAQLVLDKIRSESSSDQSYVTAVGKLRSYLIDLGERHAMYEASLQVLEDELRSLYPSDDRRLLFLDHFKAVPLNRQVNVVKKLTRGLMPGYTDCKEFHEQVRRIHLLPAYVRDMKPTYAELQRARQQSDKRQEERSRAVICFEKPCELIRRCTAILKHADDNTLESVATALALLTGRRTIELLWTGTFSALPGCRHYVVFTGQVKTGTQKIETVTVDSDMSYTIPVLQEAGLIVRSLESLQRRVKSVVGEQVPSYGVVNHRFSHLLSKAVKDVIHPKLRFHDLRTLYALISFEAFKPHTYGLNGWVSFVLGHAGLSQSVCYTRMQIGHVRRFKDAHLS